MSIYAEPSGGNGSHLDMLHESPYCQGIASETLNRFWVVDGNLGDIVMYDFKADHGPGNNDHADGVVHRPKHALGFFPSAFGPRASGPLSLRRDAWLMGRAGGPIRPAHSAKSRASARVGRHASECRGKSEQRTLCLTEEQRRMTEREVLAQGV